MVSSHLIIAQSSGYRAFAESPCFAKPTYSRATLAFSTALPVTVCAGRPSRFAGGQCTALCLSSVSRLRPGASSTQAWAFHAHQVAGFGHEVWAVPAAISERLMRLPVSQRLKPKSSMPERFCTSPFASACVASLPFVGVHGRRTSSRASSSKQDQVGSHQPPNPSFKRTHKGLRPLRSA